MHTLFSKKTPLVILLTLACIALWPGCDNEDDPTGPECNISGATFTYNTNVKGIIDRHCIGCHFPGSTVAGIVGDYTTYEGMKTNLDNDRILDRVVIKKDMPQGNPTNMTQAERDSINCWIQAGYPKN